MNLALHKAVFASSSHMHWMCKNYDCKPDNAVDGDTSSQQSLFSSAPSDTSPWLSIDLGAIAIVHSIILYKNPFCWCDWLVNASLLVGNASITSDDMSDATTRISPNQLVWNQTELGTTGEKVYIQVDPPVVGRWVTLQNGPRQINIGELEVYGTLAAPLPPQPPAAPSGPPAVDDPPVRGINSQCGSAGQFDMHAHGVCVERTLGNFPCPYMNAVGRINVIYRLIYENPDGSRSSGGSALTMECVERTSTFPMLYVEFRENVALAPGQFVVLQQQNRTVCSSGGPWDDVMRVRCLCFSTEAATSFAVVTPRLCESSSSDCVFCLPGPILHPSVRSMYVHMATPMLRPVPKPVQSFEIIWAF
ncbi:hypothetical protein VOLCADRAFT_87443 [Volvox carteri f. nagariensis]|uniref:Uncharacterized protein n=1 Tax=Volvox carteri f. nagariensis TaxID=3068 RepID=D8TLC6_VOLCA|nr:uncharacterized protein VOLCADRAFT_87443 [Volvox carteri f. nagariensis]EFJ51712.1 hypothetical protein VOLCADRAFT_87443 [Volvox carteri f. nagariensis]|eukprot:XP_002947122.1 hypothetical protein VOLCADRAFT_87443 [Volvox carteri f. nagariensis]